MEKLIDRTPLSVFLAVLIAIALATTGIGFALALGNDGVATQSEYDEEIVPGDDGDAGASIQCPNCGIDNDDTEEFCRACGASLLENDAVVGNNLTKLNIVENSTDEYGTGLHINYDYGYTEHQFSGWYTDEVTFIVKVNGEQVDVPADSWCQAGQYFAEIRFPNYEFVPGDVVTIQDSEGGSLTAVYAKEDGYGTYDLTIKDTSIEAGKDLYLMNTYSTTSSENEVSYNSVPLVDDTKYTVVEKVVTTTGDGGEQSLAVKTYLKHKDEIDALNALDDWDANSELAAMSSTMVDEGGKTFPVCDAGSFVLVQWPDGSAISISSVGEGWVSDGEGNSYEFPYSPVSTEISYEPVYSFTFDQDLKATAVNNLIVIDNINGNTGDETTYTLKIESYGDKGLTKDDIEIVDNNLVLHNFYVEDGKWMTYKEIDAAPAGALEGSYSYADKSIYLTYDPESDYSENINHLNSTDAYIDLTAFAQADSERAEFSCCPGILNGVVIAKGSTTVEEYAYTINYYKDSTDQSSLLATFDGEAALGEEISLSMAELNKYLPMGYEPLTKSLSITISNDAGDNVLDVVYDSKQMYAYTINYYIGSVDEENLLAQESGMDEYEQTIHLSFGEIAKYVPMGYVSPDYVEPLIISIDPSQNIINVVYERGTFAYTVNYYKDSTDNEPFNTVKGTGLYETEIPYDIAGNLPSGYKADASVEGRFTISADAYENVLNIIYTKDDKAKNSIGFNIGFKASGIQSTGFSSYLDAFAAMGK